MNLHVEDGVSERTQHCNGDTYKRDPNNLCRIFSAYGINIYLY